MKMAKLEQIINEERSEHLLMFFGMHSSNEEKTWLTKRAADRGSLIFP
jgi:hypothetical protein